MKGPLCGEIGGKSNSWPLLWILENADILVCILNAQSLTMETRINEILVASMFRVCD